MDEDDDLKNKEKTFKEEWNEVVSDFDDILTFCWDMSWGFFDGGKSFEEGLEILDSSYNLYDWLSPETRALIEDEEQIMMIDYEFTKAKGRYMDYFNERSLNFLSNFDPYTLEVFIEFMVVYLLEFNGKFTLMSPIFTAYAPILIGADLVSL